MNMFKKIFVLFVKTNKDELIIEASARVLPFRHKAALNRIKQLVLEQALDDGDMVQSINLIAEYNDSKYNHREKNSELHTPAYRIHDDFF